MKRRQGRSSSAHRSGSTLLLLSAVFLAAAGTLGASLPAGAAPQGGAQRAQVHAAAETLLETLTVPRPPQGSPADAYRKTSSTVLAAGSTYRLVVSGVTTATSSGMTIHGDALYCFQLDNPTPSYPPCTPPRRGTPLTFMDANLELDRIPGYAGPLLPYDPGHRYVVTFTPPTTGPLVANVSVGIGSATGAWTIEIYGQAPAAPPPPGGGPQAEQAPTLVPAATSWGRPGRAVALEPGDEAVLVSPPIGPRQSEASVTVSGDPSGATDVVAATDKLGKVVHCIVEGLAAVVEQENKDERDWIFDQLFYDPEDRRPYPGLRGEETRIFVKHVAACLGLLVKARTKARSASVANIGGIAKSSCKTRSVPVQVRVNRTAKTLRWRRRPARRRSPARFLRTSCRRAANGKVTLRIRSRSRRVKLRKLVGPRLFVGVHRSPAAPGPASVRATFKR